jgi:pseudouridine-5'-phosphate glycosidase
MDQAVELHDAVPAVTAVVGGTPTIGLEPDELERFLAREGVRKVSARDLPLAMAAGRDGATTVAASIALATLAGVPVFATGGIGGVHRGLSGPDSWVGDESADLFEMTRAPLVVVCAGAKSILDLPATVERLETLGVPVVGYRTSELPGFFTAETGIEIPVRVESARAVAELFAAHLALGRPGAMLVVQPPPAQVALPREMVDEAVQHALTQARHDGIRGAALTPYLLAAVERQTEGRSLLANLALLAANAALAGEIAVALGEIGIGMGWRGK